MIKFLKIRNVKDPKRNNGEDAGIDFFTPEYSPEFEEVLRLKNPNTNINEECIYVEPHRAVLIPAGIKSVFDSNLALIAHNKSGVCTKTQLVVGAQVIDSSYQGEWHIHVINTSDKMVRIDYGSKLTQFIPLYIYDGEFSIQENIPENEFFKNTTSRGAGGFGSTGLN